MFLASFLFSFSPPLTHQLFLFLSPWCLSFSLLSPLLYLSSYRISSCSSSIVLRQCHKPFIWITPTDNSRRLPSHANVISPPAYIFLHAPGDTCAHLRIFPRLFMCVCVSVCVFFMSMCLNLLRTSLFPCYFHFSASLLWVCKTVCKFVSMLSKFPLILS